MAAIVINGNAIAAAVRREWKGRAEALKRRGVLPALAVVIAGDSLASKIYVRNKVKACCEVGLHSEVHELPTDIGEDMVLAHIRRLNHNPNIHGILVQLPLPPQLNRDKVLATVSADKDVDGFHVHNLGALVTGNALFPPCTPFGIQCLLDHMQIPIEGQNAVVVGRSTIVGKPMALMLLQKGATVTVCTSKTRDLATYTRLADILVVAAGKPNLITAAMVKEGAAVIDVGINRAPDGRLVGDVDFDGGPREGRLPHARAGWGRSDDGSDAHRQHGARRRAGGGPRVQPCAGGGCRGACIVRPSLLTKKTTLVMLSDSDEGDPTP